MHTLFFSPTHRYTDGPSDPRECPRRGLPFHSQSVAHVSGERWVDFLPLFTAIRKRRVLVNIWKLYFSSVPCKVHQLVFIFQQMNQFRWMNSIIWRVLMCVMGSFFLHAWPLNSVMLQNRFPWVNKNFCNILQLSVLFTSASVITIRFTYTKRSTWT